MEEKRLRKLGNNIRCARKSKHLSQEKLAELVGKTRNYIGMVERAELNISAKSILSIADALNVEAKLFFEF